MFDINLMAKKCTFYVQHIYFHSSYFPLVFLKFLYRSIAHLAINDLRPESVFVVVIIHFVFFRPVLSLLVSNIYIDCFFVKSMSFPFKLQQLSILKMSNKKIKTYHASNHITYLYHTCCINKFVNSSY